MDKPVHCGDNISLLIPHHRRIIKGNQFGLKAKRPPGKSDRLIGSVLKAEPIVTPRLIFNKRRVSDDAARKS